MLESAVLSSPAALLGREIAAALRHTKEIQQNTQHTNTHTKRKASHRGALGVGGEALDDAQYGLVLEFGLIVVEVVDNLIS